MSKLKLTTNIDGPALIVPLPRLIDTSWGEAFEAQSKEWLATPSRLFVLDFENSHEIKNQVYRAIVVFARNCRKEEKFLVSLNMKESIINRLSKDGVLESFNPLKSMVEARGLLGETQTRSAPKLDVRLINPFIQATVKTLEVQAQTPSKPGKPFLLKVEEKGDKPPVAIAGVIALSSSEFNGSITLAFPEKVFLKIYGNMFGENPDHITAEIEDAAGEILNIIYGTAKTELNAQFGMDLRPALPTILSGDKIRIRQKTMEMLIILPFETDAGQFQIEVALDRSRAG